MALIFPGIPIGYPTDIELDDRYNKCQEVSLNEKIE